MNPPSGQRVYFPATEAVPRRSDVVWVPEDETLNVYAGAGCLGLGECNIVVVAGGRPGVSSYLPVAIDLGVDPAITRGVTGRGA